MGRWSWASGPRVSPPLSNRYPARAILRRMSHPPDLIRHGLEQARLALLAVINMTNAHLRPLTLRRSLKQHVGCMKATGRNAPSLRPIQNGALRYA